MLSIQTIGSVNVIQLRSALVDDSVQQCRQTITDILERRKNLLVLDMSESPLIDSEGLELIVDSQEACLNRGGRLALVDPQPLCREVLEFTGVSDFVEVYRELREALRDFAR